MTQPTIPRCRLQLRPPLLVSMNQYANSHRLRHVAQCKLRVDVAVVETRLVDGLHRLDVSPDSALLQYREREFRIGHFNDC
jgi:hypothetical protein